jgi:cell shape-determining protein MreD
MPRARPVAGAAAVLTALLLQATLVGPLTATVTGPVAIGLPAVLVAAVALVDGPGAGMALGFAAGLIADLGSNHPGGVLAVSWLALGLLAGVVGERRSLVSDVLAVGVTCALVAGLSSLLLVALHADGATVRLALRGVPVAAVVAGLLAVAVVPLTRAVLRSPTLRPPRPLPPELLVGRHDG